MMKVSSKISQQIIALFLAASLGVLCFILFEVIPQQKYLQVLDAEIKNLADQLAEQRRLFPLYRDLLKKSKAKRPGPLPFPKKGKLDRNKIDKISFIFEELAGVSHLELIRVVPDVASLKEDAGLLSLNAQLIGNFANFRSFFVQLERLPYLAHVEEIQIESKEGFKEIGLKIWLALTT